MPRRDKIVAELAGEVSIIGTTERSESKTLGFGGRVPRIASGNRWDYHTVLQDSQSVSDQKTSPSMVYYNRSRLAIDGNIS